MSVCAVMLVKDEADVIEATIRHLAGQVDEVIVADNLSTDGTTEILRDLATDGLPVMVVTDPEPGYFQSRKTTQLALAALDRGHGWVVPCDADELWYSPDGRRVADVLSVSPAAVVEATIFNHVPTGVDDPAETNPFRRLRWRLEAPGRLPKVAARLTPSLVIEQGNHGAGYDDLHGGVDYAGRVRVPRPTLHSGGLEIRHFSWRSAEQYCNPPEAPIWMADYSFRPLGAVAIGDEVIGFGRVEGRTKVSFVKSRVLAVNRRISPIIRVDFASGRSLRCTPDHLWWQPHYRFSPPVYKEAKVGRSLGYVIEPSFPVTGSDSWLAGWLAGIYDGEGHAEQIAQSLSHNPELYERIAFTLEHFGFEVTRAYDRIHLLGGRDSYVRFVNMMQPTRRTSWREKSLLGGAVGGRISTPDKIVNIEPSGRGEVIGLTTTSGNYVAWGYASKNCRKIRNGEAAYAATDLPDDVGGHWRAFAGKPDQAVVDHFYRWFYVADPTVDPHVYDGDGNVDSIVVLDPAPVEGEPPVPYPTVETSP